MSEIARPNSGLPRGILIGAAVLIAFAIATTLFGRVSDIGTLHMPAADGGADALAPVRGSRRRLCRRA